MATVIEKTAVVANPKNVKRFANNNDKIDIQEVEFTIKESESGRHYLTVNFKKDNMTRIVMSDNLVDNLNLKPGKNKKYDLSGITHLGIKAGIFETKK
jgi:hypothetical protein